MSGMESCFHSNDGPILNAPETLFNNALIRWAEKVVYISQNLMQNCKDVKSEAVFISASWQNMVQFEFIHSWFAFSWFQIKTTQQ